MQWREADSAVQSRILSGYRSSGRRDSRRDRAGVWGHSSRRSRPFPCVTVARRRRRQTSFTWDGLGSGRDPGPQRRLSVSGQRIEGTCGEAVGASSKRSWAPHGCKRLGLGLAETGGSLRRIVGAARRWSVGLSTAARARIVVRRPRWSRSCGTSARDGWWARRSRWTRDHPRRRDACQRCGGAACAPQVDRRRLGPTGRDPQSQARQAPLLSALGDRGLAHR